MSTHHHTSKLYRAIHAQPEAIRTLLADWQETELAAEKLAGAQRILLVGIGTSYHASQVGEYLLRMIGVDAWALRAFEFVNYPRPLASSDAVIIISHRGSKQYSTQAIERARVAGVPVIGITGKQTKMQGADLMLETVDQDPSSTHTISYLASLTRLSQITVALASRKGHSDQARSLKTALASIPTHIEQLLEHEDEIRQVAQEAVVSGRRLYVVGAGPNAITAPEGALKAKEAAYVTTEGFELEQSIHGPLVAFEHSDLVIPINVQGGGQTRMKSLLAALHVIGCRVWLIGSAPDNASAALFEREGWSQFALPDASKLPEELTPLLTTVPLQLLADFLATARGTNADSFRLEQDTYKAALAKIQL